MSANLGFRLTENGYATLPRKLTKEEETLVTRIFHESDMGKKGFLSREDMKVAMVELFGYKPTKYEVDGLLKRYGQSIGQHSAGLALECFVQAMSEKMVQQDEDEVIRQTFMAFDVQCHGFLTVEDVQKIMSQVAPHIPAQAVHSAFREVDRDGDGRVSYKDFDFLMKYSTVDHI